MLELNGRERKVTRNLKRKHDEINHIQKVSTLLQSCNICVLVCGSVFSSGISPTLHLIYIPLILCIAMVST